MRDAQRRAPPSPKCPPVPSGTCLLWVTPRPHRCTDATAALRSYHGRTVPPVRLRCPDGPYRSYPGKYLRVNRAHSTGTEDYQIPR